MENIEDEKTNKPKESYGNIFKTTFLFGFVKVFTIIIRIILNKLTAILLGKSGVGVIGLYNSAVGMLGTIAGLGVSQSAVRDISEANGENDEVRFSRVISLTNRIILFTSLLGVVATILLSPVLSRWAFGNNNYTIAYIWLSIVVGLNIMSEGQFAILKGMRQMRAVAKASIIGSVVGLVSAVPFYYLFGQGGIIPALIIAAFSALFFSNFYVRKIKYTKTKLTWKETFQGSSLMIKMGIALMMVSFMGYFFDLVVSSFISKSGGLDDVGLYHAGATIVTGYFGVIITAMSTDYYPRISAVHKYNDKIEEEMNKQSEVGLLIAFPLVISFVCLSSFFIKLLYTSEFIKVHEYTDYALIGIVIIIVSNCMGMVLLAKQVAKVFLVTTIIQRVVLLGVYCLLYVNYGLRGLGFAYIATGVIHIFVMYIVLNNRYQIKLRGDVIRLLLLIISFTLLSIAVRHITLLGLRYTIFSVLFLFSLWYSYNYARTKMSIDVVKIIANKIRAK